MLLSFQFESKSVSIAMATTATIPEGGTWLDTMKRSFEDVPVDESSDNAISTTEFLEAAESLVKLFGN